MDRIFSTRSWRPLWTCGLISVALIASASAVTDTPPTTSPAKVQKKTSTSTKKTSSGKKRSRSKKTSRKRGQQAIDSQRAHQIQEALIREHYMEGQPSGKWDAATQAALQRYQADQGWQSKTVPDSRALIKLGLGPNQDHLLNPESAMTAAPVTSTSKANPKDSADPVTPSQAPAESGSPQR